MSWRLVGLQAVGRAVDPHVSFDIAAERIEKRLRRYKRRLRDHHHTKPAERVPAASYVIADFAGWGEQGFGFDDDLVELVVVAGLILGLIYTAGELRVLLQRQERAEAQLKIASGAFFELLDQSFEEWALTPSERDVALLAIKGLSLAEIADIRQTKQGTIKAQCNAIYQKAGVSGRPQLLSLFIEELMSDGLAMAQAR